MNPFGGVIGIPPLCSKISRIFGAAYPIFLKAALRMDSVWFYQILYQMQQHV